MLYRETAWLSMGHAQNSCVCLHILVVLQSTCDRTDVSWASIKRWLRVWSQHLRPSAPSDSCSRAQTVMDVRTEEQKVQHSGVHMLLETHLFWCFLLLCTHIHLQYHETHWLVFSLVYSDVWLQRKQGSLLYNENTLSCCISLKISRPVNNHFLKKDFNLYDAPSSWSQQILIGWLWITGPSYHTVCLAVLIYVYFFKKNNTSLQRSGSVLAWWLI